MVFNASHVPHRQYFYCSSNDSVKPSGSYVGDRLYYLDTGQHFIWDSKKWQPYKQPEIYDLY